MAENYQNQEARDLFLLGRYHYTPADRLNNFLRSIGSIFPRYNIILNQRQINQFLLVTHRLEIHLRRYPSRYIDLGIDTVVLVRAVFVVREFCARQVYLIGQQTNL